MLSKMKFIKRIDNKLSLYKCNKEKNKYCKKTLCNLYCNCTSQYKYAKKTLLNYIKKTINKIRGKYKYE